MSTTRPRRIVRRAVMALAGVVLVVGGYVGSVCTLIFLVRAKFVPGAVIESPLVRVYARPLDQYRTSDWPGAEACDHLMGLAWQAGQHVSRD